MKLSSLTTSLVLVLLWQPQCQAQRNHLDWFRPKVEQALKEVRLLLDSERNIEIASHQQEHGYDDKFALVEQQSSAATRLLQMAWQFLSQDSTTIVQPSSESNVLHFRHVATCEFVKEVEVQETVDGDKFRTRKEYHWNITESYEFCLCDASCVETERVVIRERTMSTTAITTAKTPPHIPNKDRHIHAKWNLAPLFSTNAVDFQVNRTDTACKTPSRNPEVIHFLGYLKEVQVWASTVQQTLRKIFRPKGYEYRLYAEDLTILSITPLLENTTALSAGTMDGLLKGDRQSLKNRLDALHRSFPPATEPSNMVSQVEAYTHLIACYMVELSKLYKGAVDYIENMLEMQLVQAVGRVITRSDFEQFMDFHNRRLYLSEYAPSSFSHAIRRPLQNPVGTVSIESEGSSESKPVVMFTRKVENGPPIQIPIDAATSVEMTGDTFLSAWIRYRFQEATSGEVLAARARQFSSFLLITGTMTGSASFEPNNLIILQNKDEVLIPLLTEVLPSAGEFQEAISSMSPEQQEFAKSFRAMQLSSSVFAVCIVQLKPQLEKLLNLPSGALSKEIQLTEDLMTLFVDYQIPSDLLSYDGPSDSEVQAKLGAVKVNAKQVLQVITDQKAQQLQEEKDRREASGRSANPTYPTASPSGMVYASAFTSDDEPQKTVRLASATAYARSSEPQPRSSERKLRAQSTEAHEVPIADTTPPVPDERPRKMPAVAVDSDLTAIPGRLDKLLQVHDTESYLRSTILKCGTSWTLKRQKNLWADRTTRFITGDQIKTEKKKGLDLLDALTRSGTLALENAELHVLIGMTHWFDKSLIDTVVQDNINPIEKAEKSTLLVLSTVFGTTPGSMVSQEAVDRFTLLFPQLMKGISNGTSSST